MRERAKEGPDFTDTLPEEAEERLETGGKETCKALMKHMRNGLSERTQPAGNPNRKG